jgi:hypothetical protein
MMLPTVQAVGAERPNGELQLQAVLVEILVLVEVLQQQLEPRTTQLVVPVATV